MPRDFLSIGLPPIRQFQVSPGVVTFTHSAYNAARVIQTQ